MREEKRELMDKLVNGTIDRRTISDVDADGEHDFIVPNAISGTEPANRVEIDELTPQEAYVAGFVEGA